MFNSTLTLVRCPNVALFGELLIAATARRLKPTRRVGSAEPSAEISRRL